MGIPVVVLRDKSSVCNDDDALYRRQDLAPVTQMQDARKKVILSPPNYIDSNLMASTKAAECDVTSLRLSHLKSKPGNTSLEIEKAIAFSLISIVTRDALSIFQLPEWSEQLLDNRMAGIISDLLHIVSSDAKTADWQYFNWPIEGISDKSLFAATQAVGAWFKRRWAETEVAKPTIILSLQLVDLSEVAPDALLLPQLELLMTSVEHKKSTWIQIRAGQQSA